MEQLTEPDRKTIHALSLDIQRMDLINQQLVKEKDLDIIKELEKELQEIENKLMKAYKEWKPSRVTTVRPTSSRPTVRATTVHSTRPTVHVTVSPSTLTTLTPTQLKELLLKRATKLEASAKSEIAKLKAEKRDAQVLSLQWLEDEVIRIADKLQKTSQVDILKVLDSELYDLEKRLSNEIKALQNTTPQPFQ